MTKLKARPDPAALQVADPDHVVLRQPTDEPIAARGSLELVRDLAAPNASQADGAAVDSRVRGWSSPARA